MAKAGCRSSASHDTFRRELLRQAMADRSRLKAKRALNQAIVVQYASSFFSAMITASRLRNAVVSFPAPPVAAKHQWRKCCPLYFADAFLRSGLASPSRVSRKRWELVGSGTRMRTG